MVSEATLTSNILGNNRDVASGTRTTPLHFSPLLSTTPLNQLSINTYLIYLLLLLHLLCCEAKEKLVQAEFTKVLIIFLLVLQRTDTVLQYLAPCTPHLGGLLWHEDDMISLHRK